MAAEQEYQVTARKWRPAEFESVVGQEHVTQTLKNAIASNRLHHAYLFSGPRGVGKTTTARILARALNCQNPSPDHEPCNECDSCRAILEGRSMDVVEIDGASNNSVEDVRKLRENAKYPPVSGGYKLYVIDEVHMLSTSAFNALLKTLEEPPRHLVFVFATTEPHKVPATILSRCQRFDFRRMQIPDIVGRLQYIAAQDGFEVDEDALVVIAARADGSMRDSHSIFDQVVAFCGTHVTYAQANEALNLIDQEFFFRVTDMMQRHDTAEAFAIVEQIMRSGYDIQEFLIGLAGHFRNFLTVLATGSSGLIETARAIKERYDAESKNIEQGDVIRALNLTLAAQQAIRTSSQPRLRLELALIQLAVMDSTISLTELLAKIDGMPEAPRGAPAPSTTMAHRESTPPTPSPAPSSEPGQPSADRPVLVERAPPPAAPAGATDVQQAAHKKGVGDRDLASFPTRPPSGPAATASVAEPSTIARVAPVLAEAASPTRVNGGAATAVLAPDDGRSALEVADLPEPRVAAGFLDPAPSSDVSAVGSAGGRATATIGEIRSRWSDFVQSCQDKITVATMLAKMAPAEVADGRLRVYVENDAQRTMLRRNREMLDTRLATFFGAPMTIEAIVGMPPDLQTEGSASREIDHPFIQGLVELLGASRI